MKKLNVLILLLATTLSGCSTLKQLSDNQLLVDVAVRQAVFRYIDAGSTEDEKSTRAMSVVTVVQNVDKYLVGNPTAGSDVLLAVLEAQIRWDKLTLQDAVIVRTIMQTLRANLQRQQDEGLISEEVVIRIKAVMQTAIMTASLL